MISTRLSTFLFIVLAVALPLATARAGEPAARELIALAPVLDRADVGCQSLD